MIRQHSVETSSPTYFQKHTEKLIFSMWPAFPPKEAGIIPITTTTIIKHIHEYLPPTKPAMKQTAIKAVSLATASLFLKLWITASMEGIDYTIFLHNQMFTFFIS